MMKLHLVVKALARVKRAEYLIVTAMAENGIRDPHVVIHGDSLVTLYSSEQVFEIGVRRPRRSTRISVPYGREISAAIADAEAFIRRRTH